jgi:hypothetical protein
MTEKVCNGVVGEACGKPAECYAMGKRSGDWGGHYCYDHANKLGYIITDHLAPRESE